MGGDTLGTVPIVSGLAVGGVRRILHATTSTPDVPGRAGGSSIDGHAGDSVPVLVLAAVGGSAGVGHAAAL